MQVKQVGLSQKWYDMLKAVSTLILTLMVVTLSYGQDKIVSMTSLEWPPYTGKNLPQQGKTIETARQVFATMGYELQTVFYPWARAVNLGLDEKSGFVGYFPEYYDVNLQKKCLFSESIGFSPLGFAQLKSSPIEWRNLDDIAKLERVGVVRDYVNSPDFDLRVAKGNIKVDEAISDVENIKKLGAKRVSAIVIDKYVLEYWLSHEPQLAYLKDQIEMNDNLLDRKNLYLCFQKNEKGEELLRLFNEGLNKQKMKSFMRGSMH